MQILSLLGEVMNLNQWLVLAMFLGFPLFVVLAAWLLGLDMLQALAYAVIVSVVNILLTSMLLMNLESRPIIFEDLARQVLAQNKQHTARYYMDKIAEVTKEDINRVAAKMLCSKPAVAAIGTLNDLPPMEKLESQLLQLQPQVKSAFNIFK